MRKELNAGNCVRLSGDVSLQPHSTLRAGETAIIAEVIRDAEGFLFAVDLAMDTPHLGLSLWQNHAILGRADVLDYVEFVAETTALHEAA